jgi:hypothetical protein
MTQYIYYLDHLGEIIGEIEEYYDTGIVSVKSLAISPDDGAPSQENALKKMRWDDIQLDLTDAIDFKIYDNYKEFARDYFDVLI